MNPIIYGLVDPRTQLVRYVGKSINGLARAKAHRSPGGRAANTYSANWVRGLRAAGYDYEIVVLEAPLLEQLADAEQWWIAYGRLSDWPLTNLTDGGEGVPGYRKTPETRARIGVANRGRKRSPESIARMREAARNRTPEHTAKIGAASKARWPLIRDRVLAARPKVVSAETGAKISKALTGRKRGPYKRR